MSPSEEAGRISIPVNVTLSVFTVLSWIGALDMVIAVEMDANRHAIAMQLRRIREDLAEMAKLTRLLEDAPVDEAGK